MHANSKLTKLIAGRTIASTTPTEGGLLMGLDDGSTMKIKTASPQTNPVPTGGKVVKVRQEGTDLSLDLDGGKSILIQTAEATSCLMLRDQAGKMEYSD